MVISSIRLRQSLSARVASNGLQSSFAIGGTLNPTLTPTNADIAYGFSITSKVADSPVIWTLDTHTLKQGDGDTPAPTSTETIATSSETAAAILDVNGEAIPTAALALAIYYEIPADTATDGWVLATGTSYIASVFSTVKLVGHTTSSAGVRSALIVPRTACASDLVTFTFSGADIKVNVVYLANTT